jgi:Ca2+-binding RTX toxin-like protein
VRRLTTLITLVAVACVAPTAAAAPPFAPDSFWNTPLAGDAAIDSRSADYVGELQRQLTVVPPYINTTRYSAPVYTVPAGQPTVPVTLDSQYAEPDLRAAWQQVPVPANAAPALGTDGHMVVYQPSTDTMWEFWRASKEADGWHADWGGKMTNVSTNPGFYTTPSNWGSSGTSLPMLGGLIRLDELAAGRIDHALAFAIPEIKKDVYSWPAQRSDGSLDAPNAIPEGTRFRIDPNLDLDSVQMSPVVRMLAEAAQDYGIVLRDGAGSVTFYGEDPTPTGTNPYAGPNGWFQGKSPATLMEQFPWEHLQALQTNLRTRAPGSAYVTANGQLTVATAWNVSSNLKVESAGTSVKVTDPAGLDAVGSRCSQVDGSTVTCTGATSAKISGSHKSDTIRMLASLPATISGGATGDHIHGGSRGDTLNGEAGPDIFYPGLGADRVNGGDGGDEANYGGRTTSLSLSLDGVANDGQAYERDNLATDIEVLVGGSGNDRLVGSSLNNSLWPQGGDDIVDGRGGADWINGGAGTDTADYSLRTKPLSLTLDSAWNDGEAGEGDLIGPDIEGIVGGWSSDTITGSAAAERLEGREGNDTIDGGLGIDVIRGDGGADSITSRDLLVDDVKCGSSKDQVVGDLIDQILRKECEIRSLL